MPLWTPAQVAEALVAAYRVRAGHPVLSDRGRFTVDGQPIDANVLDAVTWPERFLRDGLDRRMLRTWASCRASGESVRERYRDFGWSRTTAERRQQAALTAIAAGLNRDIGVC